MESQIDLSVEFVSATQGGGTAVDSVSSGLAQTGDAFMWAIIAVAIIASCGTLAALMYFRKKRFATATMLSSAKNSASVQSSINSVFISLFKNTAFVIIASIFAVMLMVAGLSSTFSTSAFADGNGGLTPSSNKVIATVNADGSVSFSSLSLANNTEDVFSLKSSTVVIADEAKSVDALNSANFTINGFGGIVFTGKPNGQTYTAENTNKLNPAESTDLTFALTDIDKSSLESLCGKSVFTLSLKGKIAPALPPLKDALYEYSADDLRQISDYLGSLSSEECEQDDYYQKFADFRDNGLKDDGSDNGVDMNDVNHPNKSNHWAIDEQGRIASDPDFEASCDATKTIQARIIGIREDKDADGKDIGLTFMTTHILNLTSPYQVSGSVATYGWGGKNADGSCTLRSNLNDGLFSFPISLQKSVIAATKGYQFSTGITGTSDIAYDKFWVPSMVEIYGDDLIVGNTWPNTDLNTEGKQYSAFKNIGITTDLSAQKYTPLQNIDYFQDSSDTRKTMVWSRSLYSGYANQACSINGYRGGAPGLHGVGVSYGVAACFCFGTDSSPAPTPDVKRIDFTVEETINGRPANVTYYPVFDSVPTGVTFYGSDGITTYNSMDPGIAYAMVEGDAQIQTVRSINGISWNDIYEENNPDSEYPYFSDNLNTDFKAKYLVGGNEATEKVYRLNGDPSTRETPPTLNNIKVNAIRSAYKSTGFGGMYGAFWSSTVYDSSGAYDWYCYGSYWNHGNRKNVTNVCALVCRTFGGSTQEAAQVLHDFDKENKNYASEKLDNISKTQTQQSINKPGSDVAVSDNDTTKEDVNKQISPYDDINKNTDTGAHPATGQSTGTATCGQIATDSEGQAQADSGGTANTSQSTAPPNISANAPIATG